MIPGNLRSVVLDQATPGRLKHIRPVGRKEARGLVSLVYQQVEAEYQLVPPLTLHSAVPELMAAVWGVTRESFLAGDTSRVAREAVAAAVSSRNACPFCVEAHAMSLHGAGRHDLADALASGRPVSDPALQPLLQWAAATRDPGSPLLEAPPCEPSDWPRFVGTALLFHYINRMVHVFLGDSPLPGLPGMGLARDAVRRAAGKLFMGGLASRPVKPGLAEGLRLPVRQDGPGPEAIAWAAGDPHVHRAWWNFHRITLGLGERHVPVQTRILIADALEAWTGGDMGLSRGWAFEATRSLPPEQQPLARFALLVALASYQVDDQVVRDFLAIEGAGQRLVPAAAWASAMATFRIARWLSHHPGEGFPGGI